MQHTMPVYVRVGDVEVTVGSITVTDTDGEDPPRVVTNQAKVAQAVRLLAGRT